MPFLRLRLLRLVRRNRLCHTCPGLSIRHRSDLDTSYVDYLNITKTVKPGQIVFIDDGTLSFEVLEILDKTSIRVRARASGTLYSRKAVNLPGAELDLPFLGDKDKKDLSFGLEQDVDMIFASFTHSAEDIRDIRRELGEKGENIQVIAKIEDRRGLNACPEIISEADGIMVSRGALGIELPHSEVRRQCNTSGVSFLRQGNSLLTSHTGVHRSKEAHQPLQRRRQACDLRNPDAGVDDPEPARHQG